MGVSVITWRLREVMDDRGISATALAEEMEVSRNAVSLWRKPAMPKFDGSRLNSLVIALNKLAEGKTTITASDLIVTSFTQEEMASIGKALSL